MQRRIASILSEAFLHAVVNSIGRLKEYAAARLPAACALLGGLLLIMALALLPDPFGAAHALAILGTALTGLACWFFHSIASQRDAAASPPDLNRLKGLGDRLEERIEKQQDLRREVSDRETRYGELLDAQSDLILRIDRQRRVTFANQSFCQMFDVGREDVLGSPLSSEVLSTVGPLQETVGALEDQQIVDTAGDPLGFLAGPCTPCRPAWPTRVRTRWQGHHRATSIPTKPFRGSKTLRGRQSS